MKARPEQSVQKYLGLGEGIQRRRKGEKRLEGRGNPTEGSREAEPGLGWE